MSAQPETQLKNGSHVLHRSLRRAYPVAVSGRGCEIQDAEGRKYIDSSSGAAVSCLGHQHPDILQAMRRHLDGLEYAHTSFFSSFAAEELAQDLSEHAPPGFALSQFVSSGSEAVEAALKFARQYHVENSQPDRKLFIARRQSYHGSTLGALSVTDRQSSRSLFTPLLMEVGRVSPCYEYRERGNAETAEDYGRRLAQELEEEILRLGSHRVAAFIAETVVGTTLGAVPPTSGYFRHVREVCDCHGVLLILDEVMCGMGRTGTLFACEQEQVVPDLIAIAKGLGAGYVAIGALLVSAKLADTLRNGSGEFRHGQTYMGHSLACTAALAVQKVIRRDELLKNVRTQGARLEQRLRERLSDNPFVGNIRGRGLFWGVELVADRGSRRPLPVSLRAHQQVASRALALGITVISMGGTVDGTSGDHLLLAPPYIVDGKTVDTIAERLGDAIDAASDTWTTLGRAAK